MGWGSRPSGGVPQGDDSARIAYLYVPFWKIGDQHPMTRTLWIAFVLLPLLWVVRAGDAGAQGITWMTLEQAVARNKTNPRPILVDVYTDWCGYCKRLDAYTFSDRHIVEYVNANFWAVKFNAEQSDTVRFQGRVYAPSSSTAHTTHPLAVALTQGKLSYPTLVYIDEASNLITAVPGYMPPHQLEPILHYVVEKKYLDTPFQTFQESFKGSY